VNYSDDSSDNETDDMTTKYKIVVHAEMHKVVAQPRLLPYYDMIRWALNHVDILTKNIISDQGVTVGTFRLESLQVMYKLPPTSDFSYNSEFLDGFKKKECEQYTKSLSDLIKDWVSHPTKFRADNNGIYSISSLEP
jgi:hypothetical protein